jgi:hypothetical protein
MRERRITIPELAFVGLTRAMIGFGAGLLLAPRFVRDRRPAVGKTLLAIGALSTIPIALRVLRARRNVTDVTDVQSDTTSPSGFPSGQNVAYAPNDIDDIDAVMFVTSD